MYRGVIYSKTCYQNGIFHTNILILYLSQLKHLFQTKNLDRVDIISNRVGKYDEFTQAKIVKLFANQVCVVQNIAMKIKAEINHVETSTKKMGYGINMFRNAFYFATDRSLRYTSTSYQNRNKSRFEFFGCKKPEKSFSVVKW